MNRQQPYLRGMWYSPFMRRVRHVVRRVVQFAAIVAFWILVIMAGSYYIAQWEDRIYSKGYNKGFQDASEWQLLDTIKAGDDSVRVTLKFAPAEKGRKP